MEFDYDSHELDDVCCDYLIMIMETIRGGHGPFWPSAFRGVEANLIQFCLRPMMTAYVELTNIETVLSMRREPQCILQALKLKLFPLQF